jgi:hypothetical protein
MKKTLLILISLLILSLSVISCSTANKDDFDKWDGTVASDFDSGDGTEASPYKIAKASQLAFLAKSVNDGNEYSGKHFALSNSIDLDNIEWTPIGNGTHAFQGHFNGNDHTIKNLTISKGVRYTYE